MLFQKIPFLLFAMVLSLIFSGKAGGQNRGSDTIVVITDTTNIDALFKKARDLAFDNNYAQARRICQKIIDRKPSNYDVRTFLGRIYAWQKQYDNARTELSRVLIEKENDFEALSALFDVEYWTESYSLANDYLKVALGYYPTSEALLIKKARLQIKLEEKSEAALTLRRILDLNPGQKEAITIMNSLEGRKLSNNFNTSFQVDLLDRRTARQIVSAELGRNFSFGSLTARCNFADKFERNGFQYEVENYTHFTKSSYVNLVAGFSDISIFPKEKYSAELFQKLSSGFEISLGLRYLKYLTPTTIFTGSITNYYKDYFFNIRTFITPKKLTGDFHSESTSFTLIATIRTYFGDSDNYLGIKAGTGNSVDENRIIDKTTGSVVILYYPTTQGGVELQKRAFGRWLIKCDVTYAKETPIKGVYTKRITTTVTLKTVF